MFSLQCRKIIKKRAQNIFRNKYIFNVKYITITEIVLQICNIYSKAPNK